MSRPGRRQEGLAGVFLPTADPFPGGRSPGIQLLRGGDLLPFFGQTDSLPLSRFLSLPSALGARPVIRLRPLGSFLLPLDPSRHSLRESTLPLPCTSFPALFSGDLPPTTTARKDFRFLHGNFPGAAGSLGIRCFPSPLEGLVPPARPAATARNLCFFFSFFSSTSLDLLLSARSWAPTSGLGVSSPDLPPP